MQEIGIHRQLIETIIGCCFDVMHELGAFTKMP